MSDQRTPGLQIVDPGSAHTYLVFGCARRGCDRVNYDFTAFATKRHNYCLGHIPWRVRVWMRVTGSD